MLSTNLGNPFIGFGAENPLDDGEVVPLIVWAAQPGAAYTVRCEQRWIVAAGKADAHEVVESLPSGMSSVIDFTTGVGQSSRKAQVTHNLDGTMTIKYL